MGVELGGVRRGGSFGGLLGFYRRWLVVYRGRVGVVYLSWGCLGLGGLGFGFLNIFLRRGYLFTVILLWFLFI